MKEGIQARIDAAREFNEMRATRGWQRLEAWLKDEMEDARERLENMMDKRPEVLTGRNAFKYAMRHRAFRDVLDEIEAVVRDGLVAEGMLH